MSFVVAPSCDVWEFSVNSKRMKPILFIPIYQERVWGGTDLKTKLGRDDLPTGKVIGESWEMVDRPEAQSITAIGSSIRELIEQDPEAIMGTGWQPESPFPILVKWLDCQERLSLQVHPPAAVAPELNGEPKTECWYVADATPHAALMAGLKGGVTRAQFEQGLKDGSLEALVHGFPVHAGESIFIPSGRLHAIGGGNLILEIQQNSDTTYRVYDWGRVGLDGTPRELHIEETLRSTDFNDFEPTTVKPEGNSQVLVESDVFDLCRRSLSAGELIQSECGEPRILSVVSGALLEADGFELKRGDNALLPACMSYAFEATEDCVVLITDNIHRASEL